MNLKLNFSKSHIDDLYCTAKLWIRCQDIFNFPQLFDIKSRLLGIAVGIYHVLIITCASFTTRFMLSLSTELPFAAAF